MAWEKAFEGQTCSECGEELTEGEDVYETKDGLSYCEGCNEDLSQEYYDDHECDDDSYMIDGVGFADPGGHSALRAATPNNPRDCDCPTCGAENVLTRIDRQRGYQCDSCADRAEGRGGEY